MPEITIVMPIYNTGAQLYKTLMSIMAQTKRDFEVLMVDDCSTDELTLETEKTFANYDKRFKLLSQEHNQGAAACRNIGIDNAEGEYLIFFDSDDLFCEDILEEMSDTIKENQADICVGNFMMLDVVSGEKSPIYALHKEGVTDRCFSLSELGDKGLSFWMPMQGNKMLRTAFVKENGIRYQNLSNCNDAYFGYLSSLKARKIVYCRKGEPLFIYRVNNKQQISYNMDSRNYLKAFTLLFESMDPSKDAASIKQIITVLEDTVGPIMSRCPDQEYNKECNEGMNRLIKEYSRYL